MSGEGIPAKPDDFLLYRTQDGQSRIEVRVQGEAVWLSRNQMAELFGPGKSVVSRPIANVFEEGELARESTVANFATVQSECARAVIRDVEYFNLDVIMSVGYRVKSLRGTQFRIWATQRLREYIVKGVAMDDERLKQAGGGRYFDELLGVNRRPMQMQDWVQKLDDFLRVSERQIPAHAGHICHDQAMAKAHAEFATFRQSQAGLPEPVDRHFDGVVNRARKLAEPRPRASPAKRPKGRKEDGEQ